MTWRFTLAVVLLTITSISAQPAPPVGTILNRMYAYLSAYESELSSVVADERLDQRVTRLRAERHQFGDSTVTRLIESEVSFTRLPGQHEWLGFRDVQRINGYRRRNSGLSLAELLRKGGDALTQAKAIAQAGAAYNLGLPRTINVPTAVLEILHPAHRARFRFTLAGSDTIRQTPVAVLAFGETARPTVVRQPDGGNIVSTGRAWIEPATGRILRVEWYYDSEPADPAIPVRPRLIVEFEPSAALGIFVPTRMDEVFGVPYGTGDGTATYRNFRRFATSARIVPQR